jgi:Tfp pilus assembly protein PilF
VSKAASSAQRRRFPVLSCTRRAGARIGQGIAMLDRMRKNARGVVRMAGTAAAVACAACFVPGTADAADTVKEAAPRAIEAMGEAAALGRAVALLDNYDGHAAELDAAKRELDAILAANPASAPAYREYARYYLSSSYIRGSRYDPRGLTAAERALDQAIALSPDYAEAYVLRGFVYHLQDRDDEAEKALRRAETLGTRDPWLDLNWSRLLYARGQHDEALARCRGVLARVPAGNAALSGADECLIRNYLALGRLEEADAAYRAQIARTPGQAWPRGNYASFLLCTRQRPDAAVEAATQALQLMDYGMARGVLVSALYQLWSMQVLAGHADEAERAWARAWSTAPGNPAAQMEDACSKRAALPILRAMRDTGRGEPIPPLPAVLFAADAAPDGTMGIFGFEVVATGRKNGEVFLNSEPDYRDQRNLTVSFSADSAAAFRKQHGQDPDVAFKGKRITVVGEARRVKIHFIANGKLTEKFYYQTHIEVTEPWQVTVAPAAKPLPPLPEPGLQA